MGSATKTWMRWNKLFFRLLIPSATPQNHHYPPQQQPTTTHHTNHLPKLYTQKNTFKSKVARCPEDGCRFLEEFGFLVAKNNLTSTEVKKYYNAMKLSESEVTMIKWKCITTFSFFWKFPNSKRSFWTQPHLFKTGQLLTWEVKEPPATSCQYMRYLL